MDVRHWVRKAMSVEVVALKQLACTPAPPSFQARSLEGYRKRYEAAGFKLTRIIPTRTPISVIEGVRL